jgi:hypothetical protein
MFVFFLNFANLFMGIPAPRNFLKSLRILAFLKLSNLIPNYSVFFRKHIIIISAKFVVCQLYYLIVNIFLTLYLLLFIQILYFLEKAGWWSDHLLVNFLNSLININDCLLRVECRIGNRGKTIKKNIFVRLCFNSQILKQQIDLLQAFRPN